MRAALLPLLFALGCTPPPNGVTGPPPTGPSTPTNNNNGNNNGNNNNGNPLPDFLVCHSAPLPAAAASTGWDNWENDVITLQSPDHSAQDVLITDQVPLSIPGKFAYGLASKDLQDEWIEVWVDDCSGDYVLVGQQKTDSDGRISLSVAPGTLPEHGSFAVFLRVKGDQSSVTSFIDRYPAGTHLLVSDIDGTLTTSDTELFSDIFAELFEPLAGGYVPSARSSAVEIMELRADQGYALLYLTGRPYWLTDITREWLDDLAFPHGALHVCNSNGETLPTNDAVGDYKASFLHDLIAKGFVLDGGYGNATTDIYGYERAPVPKNHTWIVGKHGGEYNTVNLGEGYDAHLIDADAEPLPDQPFNLP